MMFDFAIFDLYLSLPETMIHILGQFADSFLFVYLVNHFFHPRKGTTVSSAQTVIVTVTSAVLLFVADVLSKNNYYIYYIMILAIPLLYSVLFFRERLFMKVVICSIFTLLILTFENLFIILFHIGFEAFDPGNPLYLFCFFLRRIGCKILQFFIIRKLLLWPREMQIQLPASCWMFLFLVSVEDTVMILTHISDKLPSLSLTLIAITFFTVLPILLLMLVKTLAVMAENSRIASIQNASVRVQNQYLQQQIDMTESLKKFRHDYKAHLFAMDALLEAGKTEELHQYLLSLHQSQYEGIHLRQYTDNVSLNILLNQKATVAEKYGIRFRADIVLTTNGKIVVSDLISLFSNLCDNAIEACATLPEAEISLSVHKAKAYLVIEISNTSRSDVCKTNPEFLTSKSRPELHGLGIKIIKSIVEKYSGVYQVDSTDHSFTTTIMLLDE